jgi:anti-sigma factor RsiW
MSTGKTKNISECDLRVLSEYLDGDLDQAREHRFEDHLRHCTECLRELNAEKELLLALAEKPAPSDLPELPVDFARRVSVAAVTDIGRIRNPRERRLSFLILIVLGLFALAAYGGSIDGAWVIIDRFLAFIALIGTVLYQITFSMVVVLRQAAHYFAEAPGLWSVAVATIVVLFVAMSAAKLGRRNDR